jgi:hypothetical protein
MDKFSDLVGGMDANRRRRFELSKQLGARHITTLRDRTLGTEVARWVDLTLASLAGRHPEGRILAVIGASGAGKTWAIERVIDSVPGLDASILTVTAPRPCTLKQLGRETLKELGYPLKRELLEHLTWEKVRDQLEANAVRFVWLDEFQHTLDGKNDTQVTAISDTLKNLVQRRNWPISFLLSGLPVVADFLGRDRQIERRSRTIEFRPVTFPASVDMVRDRLLRVIVETDAAMRLGDLASDEFIHRLCHAAGGAFGVAVDLTRSAVLTAIDRSDFDGAILIEDFAAAYATERGCERSENVFLAPNWHEIRPENSRLRTIENGEAR